MADQGDAPQIIGQKLIETHPQTSNLKRGLDPEICPQRTNGAASLCLYEIYLQDVA